MLTNWKTYILLIFFCIVANSKMELMNRNQLFASMMDIEIIMPKSAPKFSQESIEIAVLAYGIKIPPNCAFPEIDEDLEDRGMVNKGINGNYNVTIGKPAFRSWALLGSTLAHEIEVHCNQNLSEIYFKNMMSKKEKKGVCLAEREAYIYEITSATRFGLTDEEVANITATLVFYYDSCE